MVLIWRRTCTNHNETVLLEFGQTSSRTGITHAPGTDPRQGESFCVVMPSRSDTYNDSAILCCASMELFTALPSHGVTWLHFTASSFNVALSDGRMAAVIDVLSVELYSFLQRSCYLAAFYSN